MARDEATKLKDKKKKKKDKSVKKEKKEKKRSETNGIHKKKKEKKRDKEKEKDKLALALDTYLQTDAAATIAEEITKKQTEDEAHKSENNQGVGENIDVETLWYANPMADEKLEKKLLNLTKKAVKLRAIHRGVKEVEKAMKKSPVQNLGASGAVTPPALCILASDVFPADILMHMPPLAEAHNIPYVFVASRTELGQAAATKRATAAVLLKPEGKSAKKEVMDVDSEKKKVDPKEYHEQYAKLFKKAQDLYYRDVVPYIKGTHETQVAFAATKHDDTPDFHKFETA